MLAERTEEMKENKNLPQSWIQCKLGDVFTTSSGGTPKRGNPAYYGGSIPWIKSGDLDKGIITQAEEFITDEGLANSSAKLFPKGSLLIALYGATIGKLAFLGIEATTNQAVCCIYQNNNYNMNLLFYYLTLKKDFIIKLGKGGAQPNISQEIVKALNLPVPPTAEQERIVEKIEELFSDIDDGIKTLEKTKLQIKQYRQSVLKSAFEGKLYKTTKWKSLKVKDISENIQYGYTESATQEKIGPRFLRITDIQNNTVIWSNVPYCKISESEKEKYLLKNGDFVFARTGATVGKSYLISALSEQSVFASYLIRIRFKENVIDRYVKYFFQSPIYWGQIIDNQVGVGQPNVNGTRLANLDIIIPTISEQEKIVEEIEKRFEVVDALEQAFDEGLEKAKQLKQSILKKAFEGKLVPQNLNDEPASILLEKIKLAKNVTKPKKEG